ncbi:hypothetical protein Syun_002099 [Stephania yunnanensis]|uniref:Uncharacterized protein n=1 Tax=Stephania yunnanensis TaxID=152371 RepID=A0AAP0Q8G7_9MAGN
MQANTKQVQESKTTIFVQQVLYGSHLNCKGEVETYIASLIIQEAPHDSQPHRCYSSMHLHYPPP